MMLTFSRVSQQTHKVRRGGLLANAAAACLLLSGCSAEQDRQSSGEAAIERQDIYRQYDRLEEGLGAEYALLGLPSPQTSPREWVRSDGVETQAEFENARRLRLLAFEELSSLQAPEGDAPDFSAFWEVHSAYRSAVATASAGHGSQTLVYSRPYVTDHVNGPHIRAIDLVERLRVTENPPRYVTLAAELPGLLDSLKKVRRRLDLDKAAGFAPPEHILRQIVSDIDETPLSSAEQYQIWLEAWKASAPRDMPRTPDQLRFANELPETLLPELALFRASLLNLIAAYEMDLPLSSANPDFFRSVISQVTSHRMTPQSCLMTSRRLADETQEEFRNHVERNWYAHLPPPPPLPETAAPEGENAPLQNIDDPAPPPALPDFPEAPNAVLALWAETAPLFLPEFDERIADAPLTDDPAQPAEIPPPGTPVLPKVFVNFESAMNRIWGELPAFSRTRIPALELSADLPELSIPTRRAPNPADPAPAIAPPLFQRMSEPHDNQTLQLLISIDALNAAPMSQHVVALLKASYPGYDLRLLLMERREDVPRLARSLSTLAYDLGWPLAALHTLSEREAFAGSPQLTAAVLADRLGVFTLAEAEANLLSGEMSREDITLQVQARLGWSADEVERYLRLVEVEPGFGCAAVEGYVTFTDLLERSRGVLGARFQLSGFHDALLASGSRPLELVELDVDDWISDQLQ
tara:strand:- start:217 stop:2304 length:2088 start_codon:yes stop_codon:yes gene_type:complete